MSKICSQCGQSLKDDAKFCSKCGTKQHLSNSSSSSSYCGNYEIYVDQSLCIGCGECVDVCPVEVYELRDEKSYPLNAEECLGCESCVEVCESEAISVNER